MFEDNERKTVWDKEAQFDELIAPRIRELQELARDQGVPILIVTQFGHDEDDEHEKSGMAVMVYAPGLHLKLSRVFKLLVKIAEDFKYAKMIIEATHETGFIVKEIMHDIFGSSKEGMIKGSPGNNN